MIHKSIKHILPVTIAAISAIEILDSRGLPTVEVTIKSTSLNTASASVPSGASTGVNEVVELRDDDLRRYHGKGVLNAVNNVNTIIWDKVVAKSFVQKDFDNYLIELDGTENKSNLGGNAILACSLAFAKLAAMDNYLSLYQYINILSGKPEMKMPVPMINIINGGKHADNGLDIQEFMIMPIMEGTINDAIRAGSEIFHSLKKIIQKNGYSTNVGDEGGFAPNINSTTDAIEMIKEAIRIAGYEIEKDIMLALDVAASEFFTENVYNMEGAGQKKSSQDMIQMYQDLIEKYPIFSIEDPMSEHDLEGFINITKKLRRKIQIVGDDLFTTNPKLITKYAEQKMCNAVLIKLNQIGTLSETLEAIKIAKKLGYNSIISHRSGETEDTFIADVAVGTGVGQIKTGSLCRSDRLSKYNRLLKISSIEHNRIPFAGASIMNVLKKK
jgi:enolase